MEFSTEVIDLDDGTYALIVDCFDETIVGKFNELGYDGNGYTWNAVVESVARITLGERSSELSLSPEADNAMATHSKKEILENLGKEVGRAFTEQEFMEKVIENADPELLE